MGQEIDTNDPARNNPLFPKKIYHSDVPAFGRDTHDIPKNRYFFSLFDHVHDSLAHDPPPAVLPRLHHGTGERLNSFHVAEGGLWGAFAG
jgi:hypothetical protein